MLPMRRSPVCEASESAAVVRLMPSCAEATGSSSTLMSGNGCRKSLCTHSSSGIWRI